MVTFIKVNYLSAGSVKLSGVSGSSECKDIDQVIAEQTTCQNGEEWKFICKDCKHWEKETVGCRKNYFIATVGANIPKCMGYEQSI